MENSGLKMSLYKMLKWGRWVVWEILSGPFAQLLRYTTPADARSTTVRLRSAGTASLALDQNSSLKKWGDFGVDILDR